MSEKDQQEQENNHQLKPLTEGKVIEKTGLQKALSVFLAEDMDDIKDSIYDEYIKPRAKSFVKDSIVKFKEFLLDNLYGIGEMMLFGKRKSGGHYNGNSYNSGYYNGTKVNYQSYTSYYNGDDSSYKRVETPVVDPRSIKMIGIPSYGKAEEVKGELISLVKRYTKASVADYYQLAGAPCVKQDFNYGWKMLDPGSIEVAYNAKIGMYVLSLPKPVPLD